MGFPWFRNTITKTRESICCFKTNDFNMTFLKLNDGRIILYHEEKSIKIYSILNNKISLELVFNIDYGIGNKGPYIIYKIDKDIVLIGTSDLILIDLKRNIKILQKININNKDKDYHILKLSSGLIAIHFSKKIIIFNYDKKIKNLIKKDEFDMQDLSVKEISEINNENILISANSFSNPFCNFFSYILNLKTKEIKEIKNMKINNTCIYRKNILIENYNFIYYLSRVGEKHIGYLDIYRIDLEEIKLLQTISLGYPYIIKQIIKLNGNKLIGNDIKGNIYEFNIDDNFHISLKDIFKGSDEGLNEENINIYKYNDNKIIAFCRDSIIKIWEFD